MNNYDYSEQSSNYLYHIISESIGCQELFLNL